MIGRSKLAAATAVAGAALASGVLVGPSAQAQPRARDVGTASLSCLDVHVDDRGWSDDITITNRCSSTVRAKVVLDFAFDSCIDVPPSGYRGMIHYPAGSTGSTTADLLTAGAAGRPSRPRGRRGAERRRDRSAARHVGARRPRGAPRTTHDDLVTRPT